MIPFQPEEESQPGEAAPEESEAADVPALKAALAVAKDKAEGYLASWQRAQADFVNYKRRSQQEREEAGRAAQAALLLNLLPVFDDLERAFSSVPPELEGMNWVAGLRLIERKFKAALEAQGLTSIEAMGQPFDPNQHEAVMQGNGQEGTVVGEMKKGYRFYDQVIRPSQVIVGNGQEDRGGQSGEQG